PDALVLRLGVVHVDRDPRPATAVRPPENRGLEIEVGLHESQLAVAEPQQDEPAALALVNHGAREHGGVELARLAHLVGDEAGPEFLELHAGLSGGPGGRCVERIYPAP